MADQRKFGIYLRKNIKKSVEMSVPKNTMKRGTAGKSMWWNREIREKKEK